MRALVSLIFALNCLPFFAQNETIRSEIEKLIRFETEISYEEIPGFIVSIIDGPEMHHFGFGSYAEWSSTDLSTCRFQIGGLTKVFTAHLAAETILTDRPEHVSDFLSSLSDSDVGRIPISDLLSHLSGMAKLPSNLGQVVSTQDTAGRYASYTREDLIQFCRGSSLPSNGRYGYSHVNYALLELILEASLRQDYGSAMDAFILTPFGMTDTDFSTDRLEPGFSRAGQRVSPWTFSSFLGSEGLATTHADLALYMQSCLSADHPNAKSFTSMLEPIAKVPSSKRSFVATGWHLFERNGHRIYLHSGKTDGHAASIQFVPKTKTAVLITANAPGSLYGLGMAILRMINYNWKRKKDG